MLLRCCSFWCRPFEQDLRLDTNIAFFAVSAYSTAPTPISRITGIRVSAAEFDVPVCIHRAAAAAVASSLLIYLSPLLLLLLAD